MNWEVTIGTKNPIKTANKIPKQIPGKSTGNKTPKHIPMAAAPKVST